MKKESTSFWAEIKKFEEILAKDPHSYCFAPLSELYRKLGLLDDALSVAKRGAEIHPEYIGGHIALGRAYFEKGMNLEAKQSLEKVVKATPENLLAQKLLYRIYQEEGNIRAAEQALKLLVAFNPEDSESRAVLESIQCSPVHSEIEQSYTEEVKIVEPLDLHPDPSAAIEPIQAFEIPLGGEVDIQDPAEAGLPMEPDFFVDEWTDVSDMDTPGRPDDAVPMPTVTLAELYVSQGFYDKALEIYYQLAQDEPENSELAARIGAVKELMPLSAEVASSVFPHGFATSGETGSICLEAGAGPKEISCPEMALVEELEQWLHSIRRRKECR